MYTVGTAGHVDHGKSTLIEALTGIDPDRLREEKERGMTIDLGFAWLTLPSGREISIVDVPGHERFIKNMLAGVGGIDAALLVVAADEGVMPQTREHLDILTLLGIERGLVALTKQDLVDPEWLELVSDETAEALKTTSLASAKIVPVSALGGDGLPDLLTEQDLVDPEWLELVSDETAEALKTTSLASAKIVPVSALGGDGLPDLLSALAALLAQTAPMRAVGRPRLPVARV